MNECLRLRDTFQQHGHSPAGNGGLDGHSEAGVWNKSLSGEARQAHGEDGISDSAGTGSDS